jgi:hypothetical protein
MSGTITGGFLLLAEAANNQQKYNEAIRSAQQFELLGYVLGGVGILLVLASIPLAIYWDRKKKARKQGGQRASEGPRSEPDQSPR